MVLNNTVASQIKTLILDKFDEIDHLGFSSSATVDPASADSLSGEFIRKALDSVVKDSGAFVYTFNAVLGLTEGNGNTFRKLGLFTDLAGNTLEINQVLDSGVAKTIDKEINCGFELTIEVIDST